MKFISIDLFSGAGGLTSGLNESGFQTILASDFDPQNAEIYYNSSVICT